MKTNIVLYIVLLLCGYFVSAQNEVFKLEYNGSPSFKQEISQPEDKKGYIIKLIQGEKEKELRLSSLTIKSYQNIITSNIEGYNNLEKEQQGEMNSALKDWVVDIMLWTFNNLDDGPDVGILTPTTNKIPIYNANEGKKKTTIKNQSSYSQSSITIDKKNANKADLSSKENRKNLIKGKDANITDVNLEKFDIEFKDGYIEQISVKCLKGTENIRYENINSIGFSTRKNYRNLYKRKLFSTNPIEDNSITYYKTYIKLSDVLSYEPITESEAKDYSPENITITAYPQKTETLKRHKSSELISGTVFTDFNGLNQSKPNGLIETEFYKRITLFTGKGRCLFNTSISAFQFIRPTFIISKIEENNRNVILTKENRTELDTTSGKYSLILGQKYTNPLIALNHQILALGADLNLLQVDVRSLKSELIINYAFRYRKFNLIDSLISHNDTTGVISRNGLVNEYKGNGLSHGLEATWRIVPEERYGFHITFGLQHLNILTNEFELRPAVPDQTYLKETNGRFLWSMELGAFLKTSKDKEKNDRFFLRWRLNWEQKNAFNNFVQLQFGYTVPFTRPNRK